MLALMPGCTAALSFNQCSIDADCLRYATATLPTFCTSDHICVNDYPAERIKCAVDDVSATGKNSYTVAALVRAPDADNSPDQPMLDATRLAIFEVNHANARPVRLVVCDTDGSPVHAQKALVVAADHYGAVASIGPSASEEVGALASFARDRKIVVVSSEATAAAISTLDDGGFVWRTAASDDLQAKVLASLVPATSTRPTIAFSDDAYGQGLSKSTLAALLGQIPALPTPMQSAIATGSPEGSSSATAVAQFLTMAKPDVALLLSDDNPVAMVAAIAKSQPASLTSLLLSDRARVPALLTSTSKALLGLITGTTPGTASGPTYDGFKNAFVLRYGRQPVMAAARAYDATYAVILAESIVPDGRAATGDAVRQGLTDRISDLTYGYPASVGASGAIGFAFAFGHTVVGDTINLDGASGPLHFDPMSGDVSTAPIEVWGVDTSMMTPAFKTIKTVTP